MIMTETQNEQLPNLTSVTDGDPLPISPLSMVSTSSAHLTRSRAVRLDVQSQNN